MGGNTLITQRRGKGSNRYQIPDHFSIGKFSLRTYDKREKEDYIVGEVIDIVKDSVHYAPIAIIKFEDNSQIYVPAVEGLYVGKKIFAGARAPVEIGNILPLKSIPEGTQICMVEKVAGDGGKYCRSSGTSAILLQKTADKAIIRLPSGKNVEVDIYSRAIIGVVAGGGRVDKPFVKAGNKYYHMKAHHRLWPIVSATAKNAADHPYGGKHKRNKGKLKPLPKHGYPIKYGKYGPRRTGKKK